jgi:hypothetical protein
MGLRHVSPFSAAKAAQDLMAKRNKSISTQTPCFFFDRSHEGPDREQGLDFFDIVYNVSALCC